MRAVKRFLALAIALILGASCVPAAKLEVRAEGITSIDQPDYYYRNQLTQSGELLFYQALEDLYESGGFKKGSESKDVTEGLGQAALQQYADGDITLSQQFQNARDAFMYDFAGLFYVDWSKLSLRVGQTPQGYIAYVGNGAYDSYYKNSYMSDENAIDAAAAALNAVVLSIADEALTKEGRREQVSFVHNKIVDMVEYTFREDAEAAIAPNVEDAYGALINGKAWCEGYARAFKMIMDRMGIPCVLVSGGGIRSSAAGSKNPSPAEVENHMWNDVQMDDGKWYGVDVTFDDPIYLSQERTASSTGRDKFLLKGSEWFYGQHVESQQFSQGGKEFVYPVLNKANYGETVKEDSKINITVITGDEPEENSDTGLISYTEFFFLYDGMNVKELMAKGMRWAVRNKTKDVKTGEITYSNWFPLDAYDGVEKDSYIKIYYSDGKTGILGYEFCVTTNMKNDVSLDINVNNTVEISDLYTIRDENAYRIRPWIYSSIPDLTAVYHGGNTKVELVYDTHLKLADEVTQAELVVDTEFSNPDYEVSNLKWENSTQTIETIAGSREQDVCIVTFDFTPDMSYNYSGNTYTFSLSGLVSSFNGAKPKEYNLRWQSSELNVIPCPLRTPPDNRILSAFPKPAMSSYPADMFETPDGQLINTNSESIGISLIASKPEESKQAAMDTAMEQTGLEVGNVGEDNQVMAYQTYDLTLSCKALRLSLKEGQHISIALPYPKGFDPRSIEGVTFEAYHFKETPMGSGQYVPEKLICNATETGLWVIVDSFSPFAVVALDSAKVQVADTYVASAVTEEAMASVTVENGSTPEAVLVTQDTTFVFTAKSGYVLDKIAVNGKELGDTEYTAEGSVYKYTVKKEGLTGNVSVVAKFKAGKVAQQEADKGITPIVPVPGADTADPVVNKKALDAAIAEASALKAEDYTADSFALLSAALEEAAAVSADEKAVQKAVDNACDKLQDAIDSLIKAPDKAALKTLIDKANALDHGKYTPVSYVAVTTALKEAETVYKNANAVEKEVSAAADALQKAIDGLVAASDKTGLKTLIDKASALDGSKYTPASYAEVTTALKEAEAVYKNENVVEKEVSAAADALEKALNSLVAAVDKTGLKTLIDKANALDGSKYTPASYAEVTTALKEAEAVYKNANAVEKEVSAAADALQKAIDGLVAASDKTGLKTLIDKANALDGSKYTPASYAEVTTALKEAEAVYKNENVVEKEVSAAADALKKALDSLIAAADKSGLEVLIDNAKAIDASQYTVDSYAAVTEALAAAEAVYSNGDAAEAEVKAAIQELEAALNSLEAIPDEPVVPEEPDTPDASEEPDIPDASEEPDTPDTSDETGDTDNSSGEPQEIVVDWRKVTEDVTARIQQLRSNIVQEEAVGETLDVIAGDDIVISADVIKTMKNQPLTLALHTGNNLTFSITGTDITNEKLIHSLDLTSRQGTASIPAAIIGQKLNEVIAHKTITVTDTGEFGIHVNMHLNMGEDNYGKYANLYRLNKQTGGLEYQGSFEIMENGQALFGIDRGGELLVTVTKDKPAEKAAQETSGIYMVAAGDTWFSIARKNKVKESELAAANPQIKNIGWIYPGQKIFIE